MCVCDIQKIELFRDWRNRKIPYLNCIKSFSQSDQGPEEYLENAFKRLINVNFDGVSVTSVHACKWCSNVTGKT